MTTYNFQRLSPADFEDLAHDLLQEKLQKSLEIFSDGKDKGIDLRYSSVKGSNDIIIQCKRIEKWSDLIKSLKIEAKKVSKLKPKRYMIVTSNNLSPDRKDKIYKLFKPFILSKSDIIGERELVAMLRKFSHILKKHFKLWLSDIAILEGIIHSGTENYSDITKDKINADLKVYVMNKSFDEAMQLLKDRSSCVISGTPGIGKTTLAHMLIYKYLSKGYELVSITKDIGEGLSKWGTVTKNRYSIMMTFLVKTFWTNFWRKMKMNDLSHLLKKSRIQKIKFSF